jgi:hypothetical protein
MGSATNLATDKSSVAGASALKQTVGFLKGYPGLLVLGGVICSLFIALRLIGVPARFAASTFLERYSVVALQSVAYALILAAIQFPQQVLVPIKERYQKSPARLVIVILLGLLFFYLYHILAASIFLLIAIAILEAYERHLPLRTLANTLLPGCYLFFGLVAVFGFNAAIVTARAANYSAAVAKLDSYLLLGHQVSELSHRFCAAAPHFVSTALMVSYFTLFAQIGAGLLLVCFAVGRDEAMKFVSTILVAYIITVLIFAIFPSYSPYFSCPDHTHAQLPSLVLQAQESLMAQVDLRRHHAPVPIDTEYYIAFPCMHIAQPLIVLWFVRKWRRILFSLIVVDFVLAFAIVLLEWHYVTDLLGGAAIAALALAIAYRRRNSRASELSTFAETA